MSVEEQVLKLLNESKRPVFLTGAGLSVPSGIPDYRSLGGVYHDLELPEYLLSRSCFEQEQEKFYTFVKKLYHPEAKPNESHLKIAKLTKEKESAKVVTQNIDHLHEEADTKNLINFHGSLYHCYCTKCNKTCLVDDYLVSNYHEDCGGIIRPDIVLYEESLPNNRIEAAIKAVSEADLILIVGTSFKVYPFSQLIEYRQSNSPIVVINKEEIETSDNHLFIKGDAQNFFSKV